MSDAVESMDIVFIEQLEVDASIGVFDWEREVKQKLILDLELQGDFSKAMVSDGLEDAIDYAKVCEVMREIVLQKHHDLLEHLAGKILDALFETFPCKALKLKIAKPGAVKEAKSVGITVSRVR